MSLIELDVQDIESTPEPTIIPAGEEVKARVVSCRQGEDKNGFPYIMPQFESMEHPTAKEFSDFLGLPNPGRTEKENFRCKRKLLDFFQAFGFDFSKPFSAEDDLPGLTGWVIVGVKASEEYGDQNTVRKYVKGA